MTFKFVGNAEGKKLNVMLLYRSDYEPKAWEWKRKWKRDPITRRKGKQYFGAFSPKGPAKGDNKIACTMDGCGTLVEDSVKSGSLVLFASLGETEKRFVCNSCLETHTQGEQPKKKEKNFQKDPFGSIDLDAPIAPVEKPKQKKVK